MILIDSNVFMYAADAPHAHKAPCLAFLRRVGQGDIAASVDAEALQEILHRYRALRRWNEGRRIYDEVRTLIPGVIPITSQVVDRARSLMAAYPSLIARDAVHAAVVETHSLDAICSLDRDFDIVNTIRRVEPSPAGRI